MDSARRDVIYDAISQVQLLAALFRRRRMQLSAKVGLTEAQWRVLERIVDDENFMPSMFARDRELSRPAVSKTLRQLLDLKLVTVHIGSGDGRQREYAATPEGKRRMAALRRAREAAIEEVWAALPQKELERVVAFNTVLIGKLGSKCTDGG